MSDTTKLWSCIPIGDFEVPATPASEAVRGEGLRLWKSLKRIIRSPESEPAIQKAQWDLPSDDLLQSLSPLADWEQVALDFANVIGNDWFEQPSSDRIAQVFVAPPGCNHAEVLQGLAKKRELCILDSPAVESFFESSRTPELALEENPNSVLVIPQLEHWYLRHEYGLMVIRDLVDRLIAARQRVLIGCGSWAWAFLRHAIGIQELLGEPWTLAPMNSCRLDPWLRDVAESAGYEVRQINDEKSVFSSLSTADDRQHARSNDATTLWIRSLAAKARGNPSVALELWQECLRTSTRDASGSDTQADTEASVLWAASLEEVGSLELPLEADRIHRAVLQWVLQHGGLSLSTLAMLLPFSRNEIQRRVIALRRAEILVEQSGIFEVKLTAYPMVRRELQSGGFLTDEF